MAVRRENPKCVWCGEFINAVYKDQSNMPEQLRIIGDTFLHWDYQGHAKVCKSPRLALTPPTTSEGKEKEGEG